MLFPLTKTPLLPGAVIEPPFSTVKVPPPLPMVTVPFWLPFIVQFVPLQPPPLILFEFFTCLLFVFLVSLALLIFIEPFEV
ncbi:hypothetical protein IO387_001265 [Campylobacter lari]|nr:hypothetical protein [Campylobacter lari]